MAGRVNSDLAEQMVTTLGEAGISGLSEENTNEIIKALKDDTGKGLFGDLFGTNPTNSIMYITLTLCVILMIIGLLVILCRIDFAPEYWKSTFPVITGALGYMYGKSKKE